MLSPMQIGGRIYWPPAAGEGNGLPLLLNSFLGLELIEKRLDTGALGFRGLDKWNHTRQVT